jgi:muconolactone D-isomerase
MVTTVPKEQVLSKLMNYVQLRQCELLISQEGHLLRLWRPPLGPREWHSIGLFKAANEAELREVLNSLPLRFWIRLPLYH